jgi:hypothetical protein
MGKERARSIAGVAIVILIIGVFLWLASSGRKGTATVSDGPDNSLYPTRDLADLDAGGGLQFVNGYANW